MLWTCPGEAHYHAQLMLSVSVIYYWHCISIIAGNYTYVCTCIYTYVNGLCIYNTGQPPLETGCLTGCSTILHLDGFCM